MPCDDPSGPQGEAGAGALILGSDGNHLFERYRQGSLPGKCPDHERIVRSLNTGTTPSMKETKRRVRLPFTLVTTRSHGNGGQAAVGPRFLTQ